jgi:hypothetical protein
MKTYELAACTKEACSTQEHEESQSVGMPTKGYAARTDFPTTGGVIQRQRYTIDRDLPLETHYSLIEDAPVAKSTDKTPQEKAQDRLLSNLRLAHPLSQENEVTAKKESWSATKRDSERGEAFNQKKSELLENLKNRRHFLNVYAKDKEEQSVPSDVNKQTKTGFWVSGAHVKGLSVVNERTRKNNPESSLIKAFAGSDWIGAHLIKREWGGEDNMWNVVSWPKAAEAKWGEDFEEPIDMNFGNRTIRKLDISVHIEKEDEAFTDEKISEIVTEKTKGKTLDDDWSKVIQQNAKMAQIKANRAIESVPVKAKGSSPLGRVRLTSAETKWEFAKTKGLEMINKAIEGAARAKPREDALKNFKESKVSDEKKRLHGEREEGRQQEIENYRSEVYNSNYDL